MRSDFAKLDAAKKIVWQRETWRQAIEENSYLLPRFAGTSPNNMIHVITDLSKTNTGDKAIIQLVSELIEDGGVGDDEREGNGEEIEAFTQEITWDLMFHTVENKGKASDHRTVVDFRSNARTRLASWLGNRCDQLAVLTMSGISYAYKTNGAARTSDTLSRLKFAAAVTAPTAKRHRRWNGAAGTLDAGNTAAIAATDVPTYKMLTLANAYARDNYLPPLKAGGREYYVLLCKPGTTVQFKNDADYKNAINNAIPRDEKKHPFFSGSIATTIDGIVIHEHRLTYSTNGAASGSKWGAGSAINGTRNLLCGAQALAMLDFGDPDWSEKKLDHDSKMSINVDKLLGFLKPVWPIKHPDISSDTNEDFAVLALDTHLTQY